MKSFDGTDRTSWPDSQAQNQVEILNVPLAGMGFAVAGDDSAQQLSLPHVVPGEQGNPGEEKQMKPLREQRKGKIEQQFTVEKVLGRLRTILGVSEGLW